MRRFLLSLLAASALVTTRAGGQRTDRPRLWGTLEPGHYAVGFRQLLLRDVSRPAVAAEDGGRVTSERGRQMQIAIWYPARPTTRRAMTYGEYIDRLSQELDFGTIDESKRRLAERKFIELPAGLGGDTAALRRALPRLRALPTAARLDVAPATGRFPLVLFQEYRAPPSNSILAEYLASHGYVVASPTLKGTYDAAPETSVRGLETHAADLRYVLGAVDSLAYVARDNVSALGVGIAASGALALQMRTPWMRALVSLEGGITTALELGLLAATPYYDVAAVRVPMLAITAPHPSVDAARLEVFRYATRQLVHFPRMGEFWFLDYGMLEREVPGIIGAPRGDVSTGFEWGARWVRLFRDAYVRSDGAALDTLISGAPLPGAPDGLFTVARREGLPTPPTLADLKQLLEHGGIQALDTLIDQRHGADSQPIPNDYFAAVSSWLGNSGRDRTGVTRHALAVRRATLYRRSARARLALGLSAASRDSSLARSELNEALRLLPGDADPALDAAARARLERQARDALARLDATR